MKSPKWVTGVDHGYYKWMNEYYVNFFIEGGPDFTLGAVAVHIGSGSHGRQLARFIRQACDEKLKRERP